MAETSIGFSLFDVKIIDFSYNPPSNSPPSRSEHPQSKKLKNKTLISTNLEKPQEQRRSSSTSNITNTNRNDQFFGLEGSLGDFTKGIVGSILPQILYGPTRSPKTVSTRTYPNNTFSISNQSTEDEELVKILISNIDKVKIDTNGKYFISNRDNNERFINALKKFRNHNENNFKEIVLSKIDSNNISVIKKLNSIENFTQTEFDRYIKQFETKTTIISLPLRTPKVEKVQQVNITIKPSKSSLPTTKPKTAFQNHLQGNYRPTGLCNSSGHDCEFATGLSYSILKPYRAINNATENMIDKAGDVYRKFRYFGRIEWLEGEKFAIRESFAEKMSKRASQFKTPSQRY